LPTGPRTTTRSPSWRPFGTHEQTPRAGQLRHELPNRGGPENPRKTRGPDGRKGMGRYGLGLDVRPDLRFLETPRSQNRPRGLHTAEVTGSSPVTPTSEKARPGFAPVPGLRRF